jgi:hypothetical protein
LFPVPVLLRHRADGILGREILDDAFWVIYRFVDLPQTVVMIREIVSGANDDDVMPL